MRIKTAVGMPFCDHIRVVVGTLPPVPATAVVKDGLKCPHSDTRRPARETCHVMSATERAKQECSIGAAEAWSFSDDPSCCRAGDTSELHPVMATATPQASHCRKLTA